MARDYKGILNILFGLRGDIDAFFDKVMVICEDLNLRKNRLALLDYIHQLFTRFADLSRIVIETEKKTK
jgi:glycyl-tRNA synthetase beta chain